MGVWHILASCRRMGFTSHCRPTMLAFLGFFFSSLLQPAVFPLNVDIVSLWVVLTFTTEVGEIWRKDLRKTMYSISGQAVGVETKSAG